MKKVLTVLITITILMTSLFVLTGCETKNNDNSKGENESGSSIDLEFDFLNHKKTYKANIKLNKEDEVTEHDEDELDFARIENSAENYVIDLTLSEDAEPAYEQFKSSAEENEFFEEVKFGKYDGYYSKDGDDMYGYLLLDNTDTDAYIYLMFDIYLYDEENENNDIQEIYSSSNIQNILNSVELKTGELKVEE